MNSAASEERRRQAAQQAAVWMVRMDDGQLTEAERGEFVDWLRESPLHIAEMLRMGAVNDMLSEFQGWRCVAADTPSAAGKVVALPVRRPLPREERPSLSKGLRGWLSLLIPAAALCALSFVGLSWFNADKLIDTQAGEQRELRLADGTLLDVAPASELRVHLGPIERRVKLQRGEAVFHVAKDASRPFIVYADNTSVRAVGTAFSVGLIGGSVIVTVADGRVAVMIEQATLLRKDAATGTRDIVLAANQQVVVAPNGVPTAVRAIDSKSEFSWARGLLIFDNDAVSEVVRRFNSTNRVQIRISDPVLAARRISGVLDASEPRSLMAFLQSVAGAKVVTNGNRELIVGVGTQSAGAERQEPVLPK